MTALMQVPETTVNKDDFASRYKDKVWLSWKVLAMERVSIPQGVNHLSNAHLRRRVFAPYGAHTGASLLCREVISHQEVTRKPVAGRRPPLP